MNIIQDLISVNKYSRPGKKLVAVKGIVIHWVANPGSSAKGNRDYFESLKNNKEDRYASAHFIVGQKGEIIQCLPLDEMAYQVGAKSYKTTRLGKYPNDRTVGIECCHVDWNGKMSPATYAGTLELTKYLLNKYDLTKDDLYLHYDVTGKVCHKWFVDNPLEWEKFKSLAAGEIPNSPTSVISNTFGALRSFFTR